MFESRNICDLGLLQNARTHGPRGIVKTIVKYYFFYIGPKSTTFVVQIPTRMKFVEFWSCTFDLIIQTIHREL